MIEISERFENAAFYEQYVIPLIREARWLGLTLGDTIELIEGGYEEND